MKVHRLNRRGNGNYALFIVEKEKGIVTFRQFRYYTGPLDSERVLSLQEGRKLYREMVTRRVKIHHYDKTDSIEWVPQA